MRRPPRAVSFKATLKVVTVMRHGAETTRRPTWRIVDERRLPYSLGVKDDLMLLIIRFILISFSFLHILIKPFM
jgi:hypothetical protein